MRVGLTADFHGHLPDVPPCDLLVVAGDVRGVTERWLRGVPADTVVGVAGNHDWDAEALYRGLPWRYLQDERYVAVAPDGTSVALWGAPWSVSYGSWEFMKPDRDLAARWELIPDTTEILVVHGPPYGYGDLAQGRNRAGSKTLLAAIERLTSIRLVVFGHIHEAFGQYRFDRCISCGRRVEFSQCPAPCNTDLRDTNNLVPGPLLVNASHMDAAYRPVNPPVVVTRQADAVYREGGE